MNEKERLRGRNSDEPVVLITGDTHRNFRRIIRFCEMYPTTQEDVMIILGDAGINYYNDWRDVYVKDQLLQLPITLFCIHGNHEMRPDTIDSYELVTWNGGKAYVESRYPNLIFAKDGEIYHIAGKKVLVIGGAYSVDKWYRLQIGFGWFEDEQPSEEIKRYVEDQLDIINWSVDVVLSHTTPYKYRPVDLFLDYVDQTTVDSSTEEWLESIEERLSYDKWYAGHYHCDRVTDRFQIMFKNVELFCGDRDLGFSME
jgi:3-oxoacid CoA-transferase subunit A